MTNEELLEKINKRFDTLEQGQTHTNTALAAGQQAIRSEMATKADMQDLDAKLVKRVNSHEKRIDDLEKEAGLPNPHKN
jgi:chaperonin cofactor prefoldin